MKLQHIKIENLKTTNINVRKKGGKEIDDLLPSIRSLGLLQPLLVRANCEGYEIVAGQRRYHALVKLAEESENEIEPVPCIIMNEGDDAKAIEASLAENIARLPMDEIDQYKAFSALVKQGLSAEDIANQFGITVRLVSQRLAIANLISPILTAYRKEEIGANTIRSLTLASKRQQKDWWALFQSDDYAPQGHALKEWLFGGAEISVTNALFDEANYQGNIIADLFGEDRYFDDASMFWTLQNTAIAKAKEHYLANGWSEVIIFDIGAYFYSYEYCKAPKTKGGRVFVQISPSGEVAFHEGYITKKEAERQERLENGETVEDKPARPELTKVMQNYLDLHRHSAVRCEVLNHQSVALRLAVAQIIAGTDLCTVHADSQKANSDSIAESLAANKAEDRFSNERAIVRRLLGLEDSADYTAGYTLIYRKSDWGVSHDFHTIFAKLEQLSDEEVMKILTFVVAETLPCGSAIVEGLGSMLCVDMAECWSLDDTSTQSVFFDLLRDKEVINAMLKKVGGKATADAHISSTAKVQKNIIRDCLNGTRKGGKTDWQPRYMDFPMRAYTKRGGIPAVEKWKAVKKHYAA